MAFFAGGGPPFEFIEYHPGDFRAMRLADRVGHDEYLASLLAARWVESGHFPLSNMYESLLFLAWGVTGVHLVVTAAPSCTAGATDRAGGRTLTLTLRGTTSAH